MNEKIANELRTWFVPPFHSAEQGTHIELTKQQLLYSKPAPRKHQLLRGVPGSGKTLVVAQRAARVAAEGGQVLILTFNITLWHYVRDQIARARYDFEWKNIEIRHFHEFCWNYFSENDIPRDKPSDMSEEDYYRNYVPQKLIKNLSEGRNARNRRYAAVLIDEGQDFDSLWYEALCLFLPKSGQALLVIDERQNVYQRDLSWTTKVMESLPELRESFRLPSLAIEQANRFALEFFSGASVDPIQLALPFDRVPPHLIWRGVEDFTDAKTRVHKAFDWLTKTKQVHPLDIVILVPTHEEGWALVKSFEERNIKVNHVFEEDNKRHKRAFWMLDSRLKISTIHSFKGWELINVISVNHGLR